MALLIHNNLIRKAKWANFGYTAEQEGDSYTISFHEAADAVKFCIQVSDDAMEGRGRHRAFILGNFCEA